MKVIISDKANEIFSGGGALSEFHHKARWKPLSLDLGGKRAKMPLHFSFLLI